MGESYFANFDLFPPKHSPVRPGTHLQNADRNSVFVHAHPCIVEYGLNLTSHLDLSPPKHSPVRPETHLQNADRYSASVHAHPCIVAYG